jgi:hypothetical protein
MENLITRIAVWVALAGFAVMIIFQALLVLGVPWGKAAWGGTHTRLPALLRLGSLVAVGIYLIGGLIILEKAGILALFTNPLFAEIGIWTLAVIFGLSFIGNLLSQSRIEKMIMIPLSLALCLSCVIIGWQL